MTLFKFMFFIHYKMINDSYRQRTYRVMTPPLLRGDKRLI